MFGVMSDRETKLLFGPVVFNSPAITRFYFLVSLGRRCVFFLPGASTSIYRKVFITGSHTFQTCFLLIISVRNLDDKSCAHLGKGIGCNFSRHLRITRLLLHVVDAATEDPVNDYRTVTKVDGCSEAIILSLSSSEMEQEHNLSSEISNKARRIKDIEDYLRARPRAVVGWCSKRNQY
ncbi:hypothetical protein POM88_046815 [Heracleum sosnowskyi]|uniref:Uncharacterized protein n=1 Tax=Heracleum sosnowskyi TaxID=360622 RepID=A0AAD8M6E1_9APIA|nr:hypothetical protein POM88_046815 [Heracleum sosnowskyi]